MIFEEVIRNTLIHENDYYIKQNNERLFKVHRRCSKRLHLICRYDELICQFSIRCSIIRGKIKTSEKNLIHSCKLQFCTRKPVEDTINATAWGGSMESIAVSSMDRKLPRIVSSAVADGYVKDTLSTQKSNASDYVFASQELDLETTEDTSTTLAFGDSMESIVLDCASPAVSSMALADCTFNGYSTTAFEHNKNLDKIMAIFETFNLSPDQKACMSASFRYLLQPKLGLVVVRELFCSYNKEERDCMILDLCLLRSMRSSEKELHAPSPKRTIVVKSPPIKKRKSTYEGYEYETDDDDVTYLDKPNHFLS